MYLDDGIAAVIGMEATCTSSSRVQDNLCQVGLVSIVSKSRWEPNQKCSWLGFNIDLKLGQNSAPQIKVESKR